MQPSLFQELEDEQPDRLSGVDADKLRGGYYTPVPLATWLTKWAIRKPTDTVLEPSCGDGAFLEAAARRLIDLKCQKARIPERLTGVELVASEAELARTRLKTVLGFACRKVVHTADFFTWRRQHLDAVFDAAVGNPPFIRYQTFPEPHRSHAMSLMANVGLKPNRLTNIWVPFVVAASTHLRPGGRLALVVPAELLQVSYAAQLRSFLTDRFERIDIVACNELFFERAQQEVVLVLADGALEVPSAANPCRVSLTATKSVESLLESSPTSVLALAEPKSIRHDSEKWLKYFLTSREIEFMREVRDSAATTSLSTDASIDVGVVTGKNEFFVLNADQVRDFGLSPYTLPLVSRSSQLKGARIARPEWETLAAGGDRMHLLSLSNGDYPRYPKSVHSYVEMGEKKGVDKGFKCSVRKPWYTVPSVWVPDGFAFRQIYDFPRIVRNEANATSTDTIHRLRCKDGKKPDAVIQSLYTHLTGASAEIEGRSYGGGVLELEPTEAERLLMPAVLGSGLPLDECDRLIRDGKLQTVLDKNDELILRRQMGLSKTDCIILKAIWVKMRDRRIARRKKPRTVTEAD
jgi:adenine-specific DNA-methyltransferase